MSKHNGDLLRSAREHVFALFRRAEHLSLDYHQFTRTREIVDACKEIARGSALDDEARDIVVLCAWFYDACYATGSDDHDKSRELCVQFLEQQHGRRPTPDQIAACFRGVEGVSGVDGVVGIERAAPDAFDGVPTGQESPSDVLHDGVLSVLASDAYVEGAELLRLELQRRSGRTFSDAEWTQQCIDFFGAHPYRTRCAQLRYGRERGANLARLQKLLRRQKKQLEGGVATRVGKGAETLYYHFTRIQTGLIGLADRRTSTMIHVNAIMMSIVVALLARRIHTERDLLFPTVLLLCVNVTVVFLAIYSMRAGRRGLFGRSSLSAAEAREHDANLLALTNETTLSLSEYSQRMSELLADPAQFQRRVIEDLYFGRRVLVERGKTLRLTYGIFIYGVTLAIVAFVVTVMRR
jgi:hypothetical protein